MIAHTGQVQAVDLTEHDVQHIRLHVGGAIQAVGDRVGAAGRYYTNWHLDSGQTIQHIGFTIQTWKRERQ